MYLSHTKHQTSFDRVEAKIHKDYEGRPREIAVDIRNSEGTYLSLSAQEAEDFHRRLGEAITACRALEPELERLLQQAPPAGSVL